MTNDSAGLGKATGSAGDAVFLSGFEEWLPPLLSVIAGMVDLIGFFTLGNIFTAHITGNLVLTAAAAIRGGPLNLAQALAIPVFMIAVAIVWLIAEISNRRGRALARLLLLVQFLLLAATLIFAVVAKPSASPHGLPAGISAMIAVGAMACQFALLRLAIPGAISTAVMTGNLTNAVLSLMGRLSAGGASVPADVAGLKRSLRLLAGFVMGCCVAAAAIPMLGEWAWSLPAALAALAMLIR